MSNVFKNGDHHGYKAGQDLSSAFHGEHPNSFLKGHNIIGIYK
jgi:predicted heme/steroid binding protein